MKRTLLVLALMLGACSYPPSPGTLELVDGRIIECDELTWSTATYGEFTQFKCDGKPYVATAVVSYEGGRYS